MPPDLLFLEDLAPGQLFRSPMLPLAPDTTGRFGGSGDRAGEMHIAGMTMRLLVESDFRPAGGLLGAGIESLRWPTPVRVGEPLFIESEVLEIRRSRSRPDRGLAKLRTITRDAANNPIQEMISTVVIQARSAG